MHFHKTDQHCWSNKRCDFMITRTLISFPIVISEGCQCVITDYKESRQDTCINLRTCEVLLCMPFAYYIGKKLCLAPLWLFCHELQLEYRLCTTATKFYFS